MIENSEISSLSSQDEIEIIESSFRQEIHFGNSDSNININENEINIKKFNLLGFVCYNGLETSLQTKILENTKPSSQNRFSSALEVFEYLANKVNDTDTLKNFDKTILRLIYENSNEIDELDFNGATLINKLNKTFVGYKSSFKIQSHLLFKEPLIDSENTKKIISKRCHEAVDMIEIDEIKHNLPQFFFNDHVLNKIFGEELVSFKNDHRRLSLNGIKLLYELYKIFGDKHSKILLDADIQNDVLLVKTNDFYEKHEENIRNCHLFLLEFLNQLKDLKISKQTKKNVPINKTILRNIIHDFKEFDYSLELRCFKILTHLLKDQHFFLTTKSIWNVIDPCLMCSTKSLQVASFNSIKNLKFLLTLFISTPEIQIQQNISSKFLNSILEIDEIISYSNLEKLISIISFEKFNRFIKNHFKIDSNLSQHECIQRVVCFLQNTNADNQCFDFCLNSFYQEVFTESLEKIIEEKTSLKFSDSFIKNESPSSTVSKFELSCISNPISLSLKEGSSTCSLNMINEALEIMEPNLNNQLSNFIISNNTNEMQKSFYFTSLPSELSQNTNFVSNDKLYNPNKTKKFILKFCIEHKTKFITLIFLMIFFMILAYLIL